MTHHLIGRLLEFARSVILPSFHSVILSFVRNYRDYRTIGLTGVTGPRVKKIKSLA